MQALNPNPHGCLHMEMIDSKAYKNSPIEVPADSFKCPHSTCAYLQFTTRPLFARLAKFTSQSPKFDRSSLLTRAASNFTIDPSKPLLPVPSKHEECGVDHATAYLFTSKKSIARTQVHSYMDHVLCSQLQARIPGMPAVSSRSQPITASRHSTCAFAQQLSGCNFTYMRHGDS